MVSFLRSTVVSLALLGGALFVASCGDDGGTTNPTTTGTLTVNVTVDGTARAGVSVNRYETGSNTVASSATTGADGTATFSNVPAGSWDVEVVLPTDIELDTGEQGRKTTTVTAGATASATFELVDTFMGEVINATDTPSFSVPNLTITAGTSVRWVNTGAMLHTVTPDGHTEWSAASLDSPGSTFTHTFDTPGTYDYYCDPHVAQGMTGTITVN